MPFNILTYGETDDFGLDGTLQKVIDLPKVNICRPIVYGQHLYNHSARKPKAGFNEYQSHTIFSDDHGLNWQISQSQTGILVRVGPPSYLWMN